MAFRGKDLVTYHQNWSYFTRLFGLNAVGDVEPKPGIPPSARHVHQLIENMKQKDVQVLLAPSYYPQAEAKAIAQRTGAEAIIVPLGPASTQADAYFNLIDSWVNKLAQAYQG
jgi:ABC-type Zn uptake system ZnuABC Zn-binding protein ZnuA